MAVQLGVNPGGLELKSPLVVAAGDTGCHIGQIKEAEKYGAAAFITKGCIPRAGASGLSRKPRFRVDFKAGTLSGKAGPCRLSLEQAKKLVSDARREVILTAAYLRF